jgi:phosphate:Na+ symporter
MTEMLLSLTAGLVLFLFSVNNLSEILQTSLGEQASRVIQRFTSNLFSSLLVGTLVTTLLDSSSAVIIITIVFVNAGLLQLRQAMGIVLIANIGTTVSSQIIAMDVGKYAPILLLVGFVLVLLSKSDRISQVGKVILYFGVLFLACSPWRMR